MAADHRTFLQRAESASVAACETHIETGRDATGSQADPRRAVRAVSGRVAGASSHGVRAIAANGRSGLADTETRWGHIVRTVSGPPAEPCLGVRAVSSSAEFAASARTSVLMNGVHVVHLGARISTKSANGGSGAHSPLLARWINSG